MSCTEGEFGAHSLEFFIPATLRLWRGVSAEIKIKLSHMIPKSQKKRKKEGVHTFINRCHTQTCNKMITNLGKTQTKKSAIFKQPAARRMNTALLQSAAYKIRAGSSTRSISTKSTSQVQDQETPHQTHRSRSLV